MGTGLFLLYYFSSSGNPEYQSVPTLKREYLRAAVIKGGERQNKKTPIIIIIGEMIVVVKCKGATARGTTA